MPGGEDCDVEKRCLLLMWSSGGGGRGMANCCPWIPWGQFPHTPQAPCAMELNPPMKPAVRQQPCARSNTPIHSMANVALECCV